MSKVVNTSHVNQPLFKLAANSIRAHKWINAKLCLVFACLSILICLFTCFHVAIEDKSSSMLTGSLSANYLYSEKDVQNQLAEYDMPNVKESYTVFKFDFSKLMEQYVGEKVPTVTANYVTLEVNGVKYSYRGEELTPLWVYAGNPFNSLDQQELKQKYDSDTLYVGNFPRENTNDALISERILASYGLKAKDVVGRRMRMYVGDDLTLIQTHVDVTGVIVDGYYDLEGHSEAWRQLAPTLVLAKKNRVPFSNIVTVNIYTFESWPTVSINEIKSLQSSLKASYCGVEIYKQRNNLNRIRTIVSNVYVVIGSILAVGLILTVMLMIDKFVRIFARTAGILLSCGLQQNNLYKLLFSQITLMFLLALPLAAVGATCGYVFITWAMSIGTSVTLSVSAALMLEFLLLSVLAVFAVATIFFGFAVLRLRNKSVKQLLNADFDVGLR